MKNNIKLINFDIKIKINYVVSSYNFTHFVTMSGQLYSIGSNRFGQLGVGDQVKEVVEPMLN
jgi:alpha-tubulin suppressor-like RCC1 family protein